MAGIDIEQATLQPPNLEVASIDTTPDPLPVVIKAIPNQSWAMVMAMNFVDMQTSDLRNPDTLGQMLSDAITPTLPETTEDTDVLYVKSVARRAELELSPVDQNVYEQQIDPKRVKEFSIELLNAVGIESELGADTTSNEQTPSIVNVEDPSVRTAWQEQPDTELEDKAKIIAQNLGLELTASPVASQNLVISDPYEVDSTDPYVKKVMGQ